MLRTLAALAIAALAAEAQDLCRGALFPLDQAEAHPALVTDRHAVQFYQDTAPGCPWKGAVCIKSGAELRGNEVLVSKVRNGYACVWQSLDFTGWIPASDITIPLPFAQHPPVFAWTGDWKFFDNRLTLAVAGDGRLHIIAHAFRRGIDDTHEAAVDATAAPDGPHIVFKPLAGGCELHMTLVSTRLVVSGNRACGSSFNGVYDVAHAPFRSESTSSVVYGHNSEGQETVDIANVAYALAYTMGERALLLRKTHTEHNVISDQGNEGKITVDAWPLGVDLHTAPLYSIALDGGSVSVLDNALLVFALDQQWSVYRLDDGRHLFDSHAAVARFSITEPVQTERYAALQVADDDVKDGRLKARGVVGVVTYASSGGVIREALVTCDSEEHAQLLRSVQETTFEIAAVGQSIRVTLTPFDPSGHAPAAVLMIPVVKDDLDIAHARMPAGVHLTPFAR